jgi:hypothetical protein
MENIEMVAATLTAALLNPVEDRFTMSAASAANAEGQAATHAVELFMKVLGALREKQPSKS